jgi:hypothetical protein
MNNGTPIIGVESLEKLIPLELNPNCQIEHFKIRWASILGSVILK